MFGISVLVRCIAVTHCYNTSILSILALFSLPTPAKILCFSKMFNMMCVYVCVSFPRCAVMRAMGSLKEKSRHCRLDIWGFWNLVTNRKEFHRIFYMNYGLIPALGEKCQPQIFKPPSLWARRTRTSLVAIGLLQDEISGTGGNMSSHVKTNVASITLDGIVWSTSMFAVLHHSIETRYLDSSGAWMTAESLYNCKHVNIALGLDMPTLKQQLKSAQMNDRSL